MSLVILNDEPNVSVIDSKAKPYDLTDEFDGNLNIIHFTNVFQLQVEKAQHHLNNLKESIVTRLNKDSDAENVLKFKKTENGLIKDNLKKFSSLLVTKNIFLNSGQLVPMSDIIQETCDVVAKVEIDRSNIQLQIVKQKTRVDDLLSKIQSLSFIRMENLASAVQSEHEACSNDISELQWHIKHRSTIEKKIRAKRIKVEEINTQLHEEINEINESIPLVEEKLRLEEEVMRQIDETKVGLVRDSDVTTERMEKTVTKHAEAERKAESERQHRRREINNSSKALANAQKSLQHALKEHQKMEDFKLRAEDKIKKNHLQIMMLIADNEGKLKERNIYEELVGVLESAMREVQFDNSRLTTSRDRQKEDLLIQEEQQRLVVKSMTSKRNEMDQEMTELRRDNKQMEVEIDAINVSREKCMQDTEKMRERIVGTKNDIVEAEKSYEESIEEFTTEARKHAAVKQRLTIQVKEAQEIEDKLRHSLAETENQIKQEIMTKTTVKSKMTTDAIDLESSKKESVEKQKQLKKALKEAMTVMNEMRLKVVDITSHQQRSSEELQSLIAENNTLISEQEQMRAMKMSRIEELTPGYDSLKGRIDSLEQKEEHMEWQVRTMNSQLLEMSASEKLITNGKKKLQEALLGIEREHQALWLDLEIIRRHQDRLTTSNSQMVSQINRMRSTHIQYLQERQHALTQAQHAFDVALATNGDLAAQYRALQTDYYGMQDAYLDVIQDHLRGEETVKNVKEVQRLQRHMYNCARAFFTVKLLYDEDQLRSLTRQCALNVSEITRLRASYGGRIASMQRFLRETFPRESNVIDCID